MANHTRFKNILILLPSLLLMLALISSCASWLPDAHRQNMRLGNEIKQKTLDKIRVGMKKSEITLLIGNPTLTDPFHANRWDYVYQFVAGREELEQSRLTLFFSGNELIRIDASDYKAPKPLIGKEK